MGSGRWGFFVGVDVFHPVDVQQDFDERFGALRPDSGIDEAAVGVAFSQDVGVLPLKGLHDVAREVRCISESQRGLQDGGADAGVLNGLPSRFPVGFDESSDAQFDAAEVSDDRDQGPVQIMGPQNAVDGGSGTSGRFAIIRSPVTVGTELPCVADVPGCMMVLAHGLKGLLHCPFGCVLICKGQGKGVTVEFAALGLVQSRAGACECRKGVPQILS